MNKRQRWIERAHICSTMIACQRAVTAADICHRANEECSVSEESPFLNEVDQLPHISPRGITSKLSAMSLDGLVSAHYQGDEPLLWSVTDAGRELAAALDLGVAGWA